ncbi:MAG: phosphatidate cytidylyltransferase [Cyanobacteria bacterium SIG30]|nr:phosphatidate cytidylyltransferase [Cyanobacteria bacterium SIG30]
MTENKNENQSKIMRLTTGWIIGLLALACLALGGIPLTIFLLVSIYLAASEYHKILKNKGFYPSPSLIYVALGFFVILISFNRFDVLPFILTLSIIASFLVVLFKGRQPYIANVATTVLGFLYAGWLPCHILLIRKFGAESTSLFAIEANEGLYLLVMVFLMVLATDIGGYFFGSRHGKHKLSPVISPKKTWEGAIGGTVAAILVALMTAINTSLTLLQSAILGLIVTVSAQLGDLSESLIKRDAGVKDSSDILPGHGGILDRMDSYAFALPMAYYYILYFTHGNNIIFEAFNYLKGVLSACF